MANITTEDTRYLGVPLGSDTFVRGFVDEKVAEWKAKLDLLSSIAISQPHAAFMALTHGLVANGVSYNAPYLHLRAS